MPLLKGWTMSNDQIGRRPKPGGWNRLQLVFGDLPSEIRRLRGEGCQFRNELVEGKGGKQILLEDGELASGRTAACCPGIKRGI